MISFLFEPAYAPFTLSLSLLFGLLTLEIVLVLLGGSMMGGSAEAEAGAVAEFDAEADIDAIDLNADLVGGADGAEADTEVDIDATTAQGGTDWLGIGKVPMMIWIASLLMSFGIGGMTLQNLLSWTFGAPLPPLLAAIPALLGGLAFTRGFARRFARLIPRLETSAMSRNHLGRRQGVVTMGTAARGTPAEVRVIDRHGNMHYLRAEPLRDTDQIAQGTKVLVLRKSLNEGYRLIAIDD